jgi:hypothetical protein
MDPNYYFFRRVHSTFDGFKISYCCIFGGSKVRISFLGVNAPILVASAVSLSGIVLEAVAD